MNDYVVSPLRSKIMSRVRGANTKIEIMVRSSLYRRGFRFRKNVKRLPGCPDIVLKKYRAVIFIHGCFWHGHPNCRKSRLPSTRTEYWTQKIKDNIERDRRKTIDLKELGWRIAVIWGCALATNDSLSDTISKLITWLHGEDEYLEIPDLGFKQ